LLGESLCYFFIFNRESYRHHLAKRINYLGIGQYF
jgi:hypothetical protein